MLGIVVDFEVDKVFGKSCNVFTRGVDVKCVISNMVVIVACFHSWFVDRLITCGLLFGVS